jgi:hypothetical protein
MTRIYCISTAMGTGWRGHSTNGNHANDQHVVDHTLCYPEPEQREKANDIGWHYDPRVIAPF